MCEVHYSNFTYPHDGFHPYFFDTINSISWGQGIIEYAQSIATNLQQATVTTVFPFQAIDNQAMWYLSPLQQVVESTALLMFLLPFTYFMYTKEWALDIPALPPRTNTAYGQYTMNKVIDLVIYPSLYYGGPVLQGIEILLVLASWILLPLTVYYKFFGVLNRVAYLLQPCHLQNALLCILSLSNRSSWSRIIFYFYLCTLYGPILALVTPDTKGLDMFGEVTAFYVQHITLIALPLIWLVRRRYPLYTGFRLTIWTWAVFFIIHVVIFLPSSFVSGRNVNYMMVPPSALEFAGPYYRIVMGIGCIILGYIARHIIVEGTVYFSGIRNYYIYEKEEIEYYGYQIDTFYKTGDLVPINDFSTLVTSPSKSVTQSPSLNTPSKDFSAFLATSPLAIPSTQKRGRAGSISSIATPTNRSNTPVASKTSSSKKGVTGTTLEISTEPTVTTTTTVTQGTTPKNHPSFSSAPVHTVPVPVYIASPLSGILDNFWSSPVTTVQEVTTYLLPMSPRVVSSSTDNNDTRSSSTKKTPNVSSSSSTTKRNVSVSPSTRNIPTPPTVTSVKTNKPLDLTLIGSPVPIARPGLMAVSGRKIGPLTRETVASAAKRRGGGNTTNLMSPTTINSTRMRTIFSPK